MSLWGTQSYHLQMIFLPIILKRNLQLSTIINKKFSESNNKDISKLIEIFIGILDGDGYFDIGAQKQYNKNPKTNPKSTIRIRLGINLQFKDKELLELLENRLDIGRIDYSKSKEQYRLILYKKKKLNFFTYKKRNQIFLFNTYLKN